MPGDKENRIVTYMGKAPISIYHRLWIPGERRTLSEKQARQLETQYPGLFDTGIVKQILASPAARKLADEQGIPLGMVLGTGKDGLITKADVERFLDVMVFTEEKIGEPIEEPHIELNEGEELTGEPDGDPAG